jgi:RNA polymerase sigma-70 factor (ECF subfamily)
MEASATIRFPRLASPSDGQKDLAAAAHIPLPGSDLSDDVLVTQVCGGSKEALSILFQRYARLVHTISNRILRDRSEADDLLQEVFLFLHRKAGTFDSSKSSARSWIVQMTYHRALDRRRYLQSRHFYTRLDLEQATELLDPRSESSDRDGPFCQAVGSTSIQDFLGTLTEDQRKTLSLHFVEGYTFGEIAVKLDQSLGNIRHHYYRGLDNLRKQMFPGKLPGHNGYPRK